MNKKHFLNSISGGLQLILSSILIFVSLPFLLKKLGPELYGVFSLLLLVGNLNTFINLGLNTTLIKYLAEQGKNNVSDKDIVTSFLLLLAMLIPVSLIAFFLTPYILQDVLRIPDKFYTAETREIFYLLLLSNFFVLLGQISSAILDSIQKIYLVNFLQTIYNFFYWGLMISALYFLDSFVGIGWSIFAASLFWFSSISYAAFHHWGKLNLTGYKDEIGFYIKKQLSYSLKLYSSGIISFFFEPFSKILVSHFIGITEVGFLDIALRIRTVLWNFLMKLLYPLFPYISSISDLEHLKKIIIDIEQKISFLIIPIICSIVFVTFPFINLWLGKNVFIIATSTVLITAFYMFAILVVPIYQFFQAKGHPGKTVLMQVINVVVNGVVFIVLYNFLGYYAIIAANIMAIFSSFLTCIYFQKVYFDNYLFDSLKQFGKFISILVISLATGFVINYFIDKNLIKIIVFPVYFTIAAAVLFRLYHIFNIDDIKKYFGNSILQKYVSILLLADH